MSKKNETNLFMVDDLMNKVLVSLTADTTEVDINWASIEEVLKQNEKDMTEINKYFKDMALGYKAQQIIINPSENIQVKIDKIDIEVQNVIQQYPRSGITAYWKSKGIAKFLNNNIDYFGHCFAFDRTITKYICEKVEEFLNNPEKIGEIMGKIRFILKAFLDKEIVDVIIEILYAIIAVIAENLENLKNSKAGMMIFYFDRVDMISNLANYLDINLQPSVKWIPDRYYGQTGWNLIWKIDK